MADSEISAARPAGGLLGLGAGLPGLMRPAAAGVKKAPEDSAAAKEWTGLQAFPAATQTALHSLLGNLRASNKSELTVLLLGKSGAGKSSTINSLLGEKVVNVNPFQNDTAKPTVVSRQAAGFTMHFIDTPSLLESDNVNEMSLAAISYELRKHAVDAVLFVDRLDVYRVEPLDKTMIEAVSRAFGPAIWDRTILGLTHGDMRSPPPGTTFDSYVEARSECLKKAIKAAGGTADVPVALIENSSRCRMNDQGEKVVGDHSVPWMSDLMGKVCNIATSQPVPFKYDGSSQKNSNPNKKRRWLIPLIFAAQVAFKVLIFDVILDEDGATGDQYGPYEPEFQEQERQRRREERKNRRENKEAKEERRRARPSSRPLVEPTVTPAATEAPKKAAPSKNVEWDDDSDEDEL